MSRRARAFFAWRLLAALALAAAPLRAHDPYESWSNVSLRADVLEVNLTMAQATALRLLEPPPAVRAITPENFAQLEPALTRVATRLFVIARGRAGTPLTLRSATVTFTDENDVVFALRYPRPPAGPLRFHAAFVLRLGEGYGGIIEAADADGRQLGWEQLSPSAPNLDVTIEASRGSAASKAPSDAKK
jgi:hypothetical protein